MNLPKKSDKQKRQCSQSAVTDNSEKNIKFKPIHNTGKDMYPVTPEQAEKEIIKYRKIKEIVKFFKKSK